MPNSFPLLKAFKKNLLGMHSNTCLSESTSRAAHLSTAAQGWQAPLAWLAQSRGCACYSKCCQTMYIKTLLTLSKKQKGSRNSPPHSGVYSSHAVDIMMVLKMLWIWFEKSFWSLIKNKETFQTLKYSSYSFPQNTSSVLRLNWSLKSIEAVSSAAPYIPVKCASYATTTKLTS